MKIKKSNTISLREFMDTANGEICIKIQKKDGVPITTTTTVDIDGKKVKRLESVVFVAHVNKPSYMTLTEINTEGHRIVSKLELTQSFSLFDGVVERVKGFQRRSIK